MVGIRGKSEFCSPLSKRMNHKRNMEVDNSSYRNHKNMIKVSLAACNPASPAKYKI